MSVFEFLYEFFQAAKELLIIALGFALGLVKGCLLALNEILFAFPHAYLFWGMIVLVLVLIVSDAMSKALEEDKRRHEREYQRQLKLKKEIEARQQEKTQKKRAAEERAQQIRQSLKLPVGVIKQKQALRQTQKHPTQRHH